MNSVGFTGTSYARLTEAQLLSIRRVLSDRKETPLAHQPLVNQNQFHHGSCINADDQAGWVAHLLDYYVVVHPPLNDAKRAYSYYDSILPKRDYLQRNRDIVSVSSFLIVAPRGREVLRSGEWYTARYAFKQDKDGVIVRPDGAIETFVDYIVRKET
jgi:hypothetical protein